MLPLDTIYNEDCLQGMRRRGDGAMDFLDYEPRRGFRCREYFKGIDTKDL